MSLLTCDEKNHTMTPMQIKNIKSDSTMDIDSGNFLRLKKRTQGKSRMLKYTAVNKGKITSFPDAIAVTKKNNPINSIDRRTVTGSCFISFTLNCWLFFKYNDLN